MQLIKISLSNLQEIKAQKLSIIITITIIGLNKLICDGLNDPKCTAGQYIMNAVHEFHTYFLQVNQLFLLSIVVRMLFQVSMESAHHVDDCY